MKTFKTPKGSVLPLLDLRGNAYLQVAHRVQWFREENPHGRIETTLVEAKPEYAVFRAEIYVPNEKGEYIMLARAHKREDAKHFADFLEKSESSSIGRALALCGYGTQFTNDLDEGERIVDAAVKILEAKKIDKQKGGFDEF